MPDKVLAFQNWRPLTEEERQRVRKRPMKAVLA